MWVVGVYCCIFIHTSYYPLANEVTKGYSNATVRPTVTSLSTLWNQHPSMDSKQTWYMLSP